MNINEAAEGVLRELKSLGYTESTRMNFRRACSSLKKWFQYETGGMYDEKACENYVHHLQMQLEQGKIKKNWFNIKTRCLERIKSYIDNEGVECGYAKCGQKRFVPTPNALKIIEAALATTSISDHFKYKLHCVMRQFFCFIEAEGVSTQDISRDAMVSFIHHCRARQLTKTEYIVRSLQILAEYFVKIGVMESKPDFSFAVLKRKSHKIIAPYSEQELSGILSAIDRSTATGKRNYAVILLAIGTGLRAGDIVNLKLQDIDWKAQVISVTQSKTGKALRVSISGQICNAVSDYILNGRPKSDYSNVFLRAKAPFRSFESGSPLGSILRRACEIAGIERKPGRCFHSLRRTFGTWLASEQVPITTIAQMLGHAEMDSSVPYLSFNDSQIYSCAMDFGDIPLRGGVYDGLC